MLQAKRTLRYIEIYYNVEIFQRIPKTEIDKRGKTNFQNVQRLWFIYYNRM